MTDEQDLKPADLDYEAQKAASRSLLYQLRATQARGTWKDTGAKSFPAYVARLREESGVGLEVPSRQQRRELVAELTAEGVPVKDQAAMLGVDPATIKRDRSANAPSGQPGSAGATARPGANAPSALADAIVDAATAPEPELFKEPDPAAIAARAALDDDRENYAADKRQRDSAHAWHLASDAIRKADEAIIAANKADATRQAFHVVAGDKHLNLLMVRAKVLAEHLEPIAIPPTTTTLRSVK